MNNKEDDTICNETIIALRLPLRHYRAGVSASRLLGFKSFEDYISSVVEEDIRRDVEDEGYRFKIEIKPESEKPRPREESENENQMS